MPAECLDAVAKAAQSGLVNGTRLEAVAVVGDRHTQPRAVRADSDRGLGRFRVLEDVCQSLSDNEVGRAFDLGRITDLAYSGIGVDSDAQRHPGQPWRRPLRPGPSS